MLRIEAWAYFTVVCIALPIRDIRFYTVMWLIHTLYKLMLYTELINYY